MDSQRSKIKRQRFTNNNPAKSIKELLCFLENDEPKKYLFRGQTKDFGSILPSVTRNLIKEEMPNNIKLIYNNLPNNDQSERNLIKKKESARLVRDFGRGIGNLISQQYGLSSGCIDVSSSPRIAAFFATRKYPRYSHYEAPHNGIIYRFKPMPIYDQKNIEALFSFAGIWSQILGTTLWYSKFISSRQFEKIKKMDIRKQSFGNRKWLEDKFYTIPAYITHENLKQIAGKELSRYCMINKLESTRIFRQKGGYIFPSYIHKCKLPFPDFENIVYDKNLKMFLMKNDFLISKGILGVEDTIAYPSLEKFYFQHSKESIDDYSLEYLWPSSEIDGLYKLLKLAIGSNNSEYLTKLNVDIEDADKGLVDRGYQK